MIYVLSDIHGQKRRFDSIMKQIDLQPEDTLYILGDVIDRNPHGIQILRQIMKMPNVKMLLGNHEHMMLQYLSPDATDTEINRWNRNGNAPTLAAYLKQTLEVQERIRTYLRTRPTHLELEVGGNRFHMVHGFPGETVHDAVWTRPTMESENPVPGCRVIIGHTQVLNMIQPEEKHREYSLELENRGEHLKILHTPAFINLDCGCGYDMAIRALACLRLEDMGEFYV